jgi:hypothetical protein
MPNWGLKIFSAYFEDLIEILFGFASSAFMKVISTTPFLTSAAGSCLRSILPGIAILYE